MFKRNRVKPHDIESIKNMKKSFSRAHFTAQRAADSSYGQIRDNLAQNKKPPAALIVSWKNLQMQADSLDGIISTLESQLVNYRIAESIMEATETKSINEAKKALEKMGKENEAISNILGTLSNTQEKILDRMDSFISDREEEQIYLMKGYGEQPLNEVTQAISKELQAKLMVDDPQIIAQMTPDMRKRFGFN